MKRTLIRKLSWIAAWALLIWSTVLMFQKQYSEGLFLVGLTILLKISELSEDFEKVRVERLEEKDQEIRTLKKQLAGAHAVLAGDITARQYWAAFGSRLVTLTRPRGEEGARDDG